MVPLADVQVGDLVLAHNDETGELSFREVLKTYVRQGAPIVLVTLMAVDPAMGNTLATIETTEEHPFLVEATTNGDPAGWTRVDELSPGDTIKQFDGLSPGSVVVSVQFTSRREQVHNLEVEGLHTYLVGADGVVVHNGLTGICKVIRDRYVANARAIPSETYRRFGSPSEQAARWAHARRNEVREMARQEMRQNGLHDAADKLDIDEPPKTWDELVAKYGNDFAAIIESSSRTRKYD